MSKLEDEAAAFTRQRRNPEAEKKARQRAGIIKVYVGVTPAMAQWLYDDGLLPKFKRNDPAAIAKAIEEHLSRRSAKIRGHARMGRVGI